MSMSILFLVAYCVVAFCTINFMFLREEGQCFKGDTLQLGLAMLVFGLGGCLFGWLVGPFWLMGQLGHWVTAKLQKRSER